MNPKVAVIIVTWNKQDCVIALLTSLKRLDYDNYDVIVIDNASTDGSVEAIKMQFPEVQIICNSENLGGTGGFNSGLRCAVAKEEYRYLWLLDNDVLVDEGALRQLVTVLDSDRSIGLAGSAMYDLTQPQRLVEIGNFLNLKRGILWGNKRFAASSEIDRDVYLVDSVSACSLCVSVEALKTVGIWDEAFFLYCDDVDWNIRFKKRGYKIAAVPKSIIWHLPWEFKAGFNSSYYAGRNMLYLMNKHLEGELRYLFLPYKQISLIWFSASLFRRGQRYYSLAVMQSLLDFLDVKMGKCSDETVRRLTTIAEKAPHKEWLTLLGRTAWKNMGTIIRCAVDIVEGKMMTAARTGLAFVLRHLSEHSRVRLHKSINDFILSRKR